MLVTAHLFMGAIIGKYFNNIWLIIPLALLSHYILDAVPHYNPRALKKEKINLNVVLKSIVKSIEPIIGLLLVLYVAGFEPNATNVLIGAFFGFLPDAIDGLLWLLGGKYYQVKLFMNKYHHHSRNFRGIVPQVALVTIALLLL